MWVGDMNVEVVFVEHPTRSNSRFLDEYKVSAATPSDTRLSKLRLSKMSRVFWNSVAPTVIYVFPLKCFVFSARTSSSTSTASNCDGSNGSLADQCFANRYILGNILLFCGDVQVLGRMASVNTACRVFISSERRLWRFCVRYGEIAQSIRVGFWEHAASYVSSSFLVGVIWYSRLISCIPPCYLSGYVVSTRCGMRQSSISIHICTWRCRKVTAQNSS